ncbi:MAG: PAS domain S-box protein [Deltaproteobacteria bacterium]|nr:PAS domain S-box protein [Deltaproteobacteria bacterium]TLN04660.1 MAG: PAS domain S-box protein [bacterium]
MITEQLILENGTLRNKIKDLEIQSKLAREKLEHCENMQRAILEAIPYPAWIKDTKGRFLLANSPWLEDTNLQRADCIGKTSFDLFSLETAQKHHESDQEVLTTGRQSCVQRVKQERGNVTWIEITKCPLRLENMGIVGTIGIARDISDIKRSAITLDRINRALMTLIKCNEALVRAERESELLDNVCRIIAENNGYLHACIGYKENDVAKTVRYVSQAGYEDGFIEKLNISWDDSERGQGPTGTAIREGMPCLVKDCQNDPRCAPWRGQFRNYGYTSILAVPLKSGNDVLGALTVYGSEPDAFDNGETDLLVQLANDITYGIMSLRTAAEHRRSSEALAKSEHILAEAQAIAHLGSWEYDLEKDEEYRSAEFFRILGHQSRKTGLAQDSVFDFIHPQDRENVLNRLTDALEKGKSYDVEYRIIRPDGVERIVHAQGKTHKDANGKTTKFIGTILDITERKLLEENQQQLIALIENSSDLIGIASLSGEITYVNSAGLNMIGVESREAARNITYFNFISDEDQQESLAVFQEILQKGRWCGEIKLRNLLTGLSFPVEANGFIITNKHTGNPTAIATVCRNISRRKRNEVAIRESEARFRSLVETTTDWIWEIDENSVYTYASPKIRDLLGYKPEEIIGKTPFDLMPPEEAKRLAAQFEVTKASRASFSGIENVTLHHDGQLVIMDTSGMPVIAADGRFSGYRGINRDITARKKLEQQFLQAQKMDAVGQLAGGIAHDYNNILTATIGYQHLLSALIEDEKARHYLEQLTNLAEKASILTQDLLLFSRKEGAAFNPKAIDLNCIIEKMEKLLKRLIGEDIVFETILHQGHLPAIAVANQIEQVLMNLIANARDAMPNGGFLTVRTEVFEIDAHFKKIQGFGKPGKHVLLTVSDTGCGMDEQTCARVFEPFFTTKEVGKGTGLGLATVYGIIKQHDGHINVSSEQDKGTTFQIYLPLATVEAGEWRDSKDQIVPVGGSGIVLLVEDEKEVREAIKSLLTNNGYSVIEAVDGDDALEKFMAHETEIDLLISDVIMPKRSGKEVYDTICKVKPGIKTLFISGYTADIVQRKGLPETCHLLTKPFSPNTFLKKLHSVLESAGFESGED